MKVVIEDTQEPGIGADDPGSVVISCADEASARKEAERQQGSETHGAQWNYLRLDGHWVAKRFPKQAERQGWKKTAGAMTKEMLNPLNWF